jgi:hypothetical protein
MGSFDSNSLRVSDGNYFSKSKGYSATTMDSFSIKVIDCVLGNGVLPRRSRCSSQKQGGAWLQQDRHSKASYAISTLSEFHDAAGEQRNGSDAVSEYSNRVYVGHDALSYLILVDDEAVWTVIRRDSGSKLLQHCVKKGWHWRCFFLCHDTPG